jgi:hypothetical protein
MHDCANHSDCAGIFDLSLPIKLKSPMSGRNRFMSHSAFDSRQSALDLRLINPLIAAFPAGAAKAAHMN